MEGAPATKKCPFCAEQLRPEARKCPHCREWIWQPTTRNTRSLEEPPARIWVWLGSIVVWTLVSNWIWLRHDKVPVHLFVEPLIVFGALAIAGGLLAVDRKTA